MDLERTAVAGRSRRSGRWLSPTYANSHADPRGSCYVAESQPRFAACSVNESSAGEGSKLSRGAKDILFGSTAGMIAKVFEHPFDLIKVRLQTQPFSEPTPGSQGKPRGTLYDGAFDAFRSTIRKEGAIGLFRGLSMPIFGAVLENATLFYTYNAIQGQLRSLNGSSSSASGSSSSSTSSVQLDAESPLPMSQLAIAAAGAGAATSFVLTPVELIKCRMQVQMISAEAAILASGATGKAATVSPSNTAQALQQARRSLPGPVQLFQEIVRGPQGIRGLWLGQTGTLLRETGGGIAWFSAFEGTCRYFISLRSAASSTGRGKLTKADLSSAELMAAGAMAGVSYNVVLFPADSVKSTIQTEMELKPKGTPPSKFLPTLKDIWKTRGVKGLYAGCGITCLRSGPSSALIFLLYNRLEQLADARGI